MKPLNRLLNLSFRIMDTKDKWVSAWYLMRFENQTGLSTLGVIGGIFVYSLIKRIT